MKYIRMLAALILLATITACGGTDEADNARVTGGEYAGYAVYVGNELPDDAEAAPPPPSFTGQIFLYGEAHGREDMINRHFTSWYYYYTVHGMRHLILESSFFTAELKNVWMQEDNDDILDLIFVARHGTPGNTEYQREFYRRIKRELPETIFHGVDIGHQYNTLGVTFLRHLRDTGQENSVTYRRTEDSIRQGREFYGVRNSDHHWRTVAMANNFIHVLNRLGDESVMGQFGSFHVNNPENRIFPITTRNMVAVLREQFGERVYSICLVDYFTAQRQNVVGTPTTVMIGGTAFDAMFYGAEDASGSHGPHLSLEFWRLTGDGIYERFKDYPLRGDGGASFSSFPMPVDVGQVAVVRFGMRDGTSITSYMRSDEVNPWSSMGRFFMTFYIP